ncbi:MAG: hypothetical protein HKN76_00925 [Saprospiraceae bacterium]|nr:hypothetical protein [Saprospiraceae bacterium]
MEEGISSPVAAALNGIGYFGSGQWSSEKCLDFWGGDCLTGSMPCDLGCHCMSQDLFRFAQATQTWQKMELPDSIHNIVSRHSSTAVTIGNNIYFGLGNQTRNCGGVITYVSGLDSRLEPIRIRRGNFFTHNDVWRFNPISDLWTEMQPFPGEGRINAVGYAIGDKGFVGLGKYYRDQDEQLQTGPLNDFYEFNPGSTLGSQWQRLQPFPGEAEFTKSFALGGAGYLLTKSRSSFSTPVSLWKFDRDAESLGKWTEIAPSIPPGEGLPSAALTVGSVAYVYLAGPDQNFWMYVAELN